MSSTRTPRDAKASARRLPDEARQLNHERLKLDQTFGRYELRHADAVTGIAWATDGALLASSSRDGSIKLFDGTTGAMVKSFRVDDNGVNAMAVSKDAAVMVCSARDEIRAIDGRTGRVVMRFAGAGVLALAADGKNALIADGAALKLVSLQTGKTLQTLEHRAAVEQAVLSPDGSRAVTLSGGVGGLFDLVSGEHHELRPKTTAVGFVNASQHAWSAGPEHANTWSRSGKIERQLPLVALGRLEHALVSPDGARALVTVAAQLLLVDLRSGAVSGSWGFDGIRAFAFAPNSMRFAVSDEACPNLVRVIDCATQRQVLPADPGHWAGVTELYATSTALYSFAEHDSLKVWEWGQAAVVEQFAAVPGHGLHVFERSSQALLGGTALSLADGSQRQLTPCRWLLDVSTDGDTAAFGTDAGIELRSVAQGRKLRELADSVLTRQARFLSDGQRVIGINPHRLSLWRPDGSPPFEVSDPIDFECLAPVPGSSLVAVADFVGAVRLFDTLTLKEQSGLRPVGSSTLPFALACSSTGKLAALCRHRDSLGHRGSSIEVWELGRRRLVATIDLSSAEDEALSVLFTPDAKRLLVGTARGVILAWAVT